MEAEGNISLHNTSTESIPVTGTDTIRLSELVAKGERKEFGFLEVVYVDQVEIVRINSEHLGRDYVTDIITFSYHERDEPIEGTLYCCAERIREQASEFGQEQRNEFLRIIIHGLLHLSGYEDDTIPDKELMTRKEDHYLQLYTSDSHL